MKPSNWLSGLASIIIPGCKPLELIRPCIAALGRYTRQPWELIVVDDGSSDETSAYLESVRDAVPVAVTVIASVTSRGIAAAINQGLKAARGEYLVLLNNDVVVTDGWLGQLIALANATADFTAEHAECAETKKEGGTEGRPAVDLGAGSVPSQRTIGLVGPMSNQGAAPQCVGSVPYRDLPSMHDFARRWRDEHRGTWSTVAKLSGACILMKRAVYEAVGGLDERSGTEAWADDLAVRARRAGFALAVAHDLFVHRISGSTGGWTRVASSWDQVPGFFDFAAVYDAAVAAGKDGDVFVEVGCLAGRSTCYLATRIRESGKAITLYAIDPSTGSPSDSTGQVIAPAVGGSMAGVLHRNILGCGLAEIVVPILTTSVRAAKLFADESVAFCFIDAEHSYASVTADLHAWWPKVRAGGTIAGHDYRQTAPWLVGLTPAVHEFFGVTDAAHPAMPACWAMVKERPMRNSATCREGEPSRHRQRGTFREMDDGTDAPARAHQRNGDAAHAAKRVLFASAHSILDFSNGASVATLDVLQGLTTLGFECQAFCTAKMDLHTEVRLEKMIDDLHEPYEVRSSVSGADRAKILYTRRQKVPITLIRQESTRHSKPAPDEIRTVLRLFQKFLDVYRPDVMLTYGGDPVTQGMIAAAGRAGIPVVFAIHNFGYTDLRHFSGVHHCIVPSEFAGRHYRDKLGLACRVLPNPVDWDRVRVADREQRYVTFVNPALYKGAYPFVRIAQELGRRRPDIPLLVVESRATKQTLGACGLRPSDHPNIQIMPVTTDPRRFWRLTKILLMPSLWWESQGLVAVEAMINGIPVIASDRGALPETVGDGDIALSLPDRLTPASQILPTAEEVEPWVGAIIRLWDDPAWYREQSNRGKNVAERWHPDRLRPLYAEFFGDACARRGDALARRRLNHANAEGGIRLTTKHTKHTKKITETSN